MPRSTQWITTAALARYLSVTTQTVVRWIGQGRIKAVQQPVARLWHERPVKSSRSQWRLDVDSVEAFLTTYYGKPTKWR